MTKRLELCMNCRHGRRAASTRLSFHPTRPKVTMYIQCCRFPKPLKKSMEDHCGEWGDQNPQEESQG